MTQALRRIAAGLSMLLPALALGAQSATQFGALQKESLPRVGGSEHAVADFDSDGDLDVLVLADNINSKSGLLLGDGKGQFVLVPHGLPWKPIQDIAVGDVDGDGDIDVVAAVSAPSTNYGQTLLYLNDGKAKFRDASSQLPRDALWSASIALGDVDGDKDLDIVIGNAWWNRLSQQNALYLNDGKGNFSDWTSGNMPKADDDTGAVEFADLDKDGDLDIFVGNGRRGLGEANKILLNDGKGKFRSHFAPGGRFATVDVAVADLDLDGDLDIVEANSQSPPARNFVWLNQSSSFVFFLGGVLPAHSRRTETVAVGDVDGDKFPDIVFGNSLSGDQLLLGNGRGQFRDAPLGNLPHRAAWAQQLSLVDLDKDGDLDLFGSFLDRCRLFINAKGRFFDAGEQLTLHTTELAGAFLAHGDFNGDGNVDLVGVNGGQNDLFFGDGAGRFARVTPTHFPVDYDQSRGVVAADFDRDGDLDVAIANNNTHTTLYLNDGSGRFKDESTRLPRVIRKSTCIAAADVDADGDVDLFVGNDGAVNELYLNDGRGRFSDASARLPQLSSMASAVVMVDVDRDKDFDLIIANGRFGGSNVYRQNFLWLNDGKGRFADATAKLPRVLDPTTDLAVGDLDGDGDVDLVVTNSPYFGPFVPSFVLFNDGTGKFSDVTARTIGKLTKSQAGAAIADFSGDGHLDIGLGQSILGAKARLFLGNGKGRFVEASSRIDGLVGDALDVDKDGDADMLTIPIHFNLHRHVWSPTLARLGLDWEIEAFVEPGYALGPKPVLPMLSIGTLTKPVTLAPYGRFHLDPRRLILLPVIAVRASARVSIRLPLIKALAGQRIATQALVLHGAKIEDARLSNLHVDQIIAPGR